MSGDFNARRNLLVLVLFILASHPCLYAQAPCPVALVTATAEKDTIQLKFRNKGKVPIEQLSLTCLPSGNNKFPNGICHVETGFFYPGSVSWIKIDYPAASHHAIEISVARLRLQGGVLWQAGASHTCKSSSYPAKTNRLLLASDAARLTGHPPYWVPHPYALLRTGGMRLLIPSQPHSRTIPAVRAGHYLQSTFTVYL